jgi:two-component system, chemotaxis family, chemotaxis protein CheY
LPSSAPIRVALIDDNDLTRSLLRMALPHEQVAVVGEASTGNTGLDLCLREKPDIVFLDVMMPGIGGLEVLPAIKDALPDTQVLMVTASNDRPTIERALLAGASGFIIKPFRPGTVEDSVKKSITAVLRKRLERGAAS